MTTPSTRRPVGLFVGLATLDVIQHVDALPGPDEKATATWQGVFAGGPALNAAVTFAALGGHAMLLTRLGGGPLADVVRADLDAANVQVVDLAEPDHRLSTSSVVVDASGARQVVSTDAGRVAPPTPERLHEALRARTVLGDPDVIELDGHHTDLAAPVLGGLGAADVPVILDAGRYRPGLADVLPACTDVLASERFALPGEPDLLPALVAGGAALAARTRGAGPVAWRTADAAGEVVPPQVGAVDTLGAGDVFHGAYAYARAGRAQAEPQRRLGFAAAVAALSCTFAGPRGWIGTPGVAEAAARFGLPLAAQESP